MSGIAGIFNLDGRPVDQSVLQAMGAALAHRGPDGAGIWHDGSVGFAHCMLHATPESLHETQPLLDETGQLCLVLDGRIDNREELKVAIESQGGRLRDDTDAELVLKAYACWAEDCPQHLLGDFAFAVWDARKRRLFCARDPLGVKLLCYRCEGNTFAFASEMQPLLADPAFPLQLNLPLIGMFLSNYAMDVEETLYRGIYRLRAAHHLCVTPEAVRKQPYWEVDPDRSIRYSKDEEYAEHFLDLFRQSVRHRLRARGAVGIYLSGGLDSSSVASTAAQILRNGGRRNGLVAFSMQFPRLPCDETEYIQAVLRHSEIESCLFTHEAGSAEVDIERAWLYPDVFYDPMQLMFRPALRSMQQRGIRVLLDGLGGDELMNASFFKLTDLARNGEVRTLLRWLRSLSAMYSIPYLSLLLHYCVTPLVPRPVKNVLRPFLKPFRRNQRSALVEPDFLRANGLEERMRRGVQVTRFPTPSQQEIYNTLFYGWAVLANEMLGLFSARFGVECRHPFLEHRLVEFVLAVPEEQRWRGAESKFIMRQAMRGILPEEVRRRRGKAEFTAPIGWEFRARQTERVEGLFRNSVMASLGVTETWRLLNLLAEYRNGHRTRLTTLQLAVGLEVACRMALKADLKGEAE